PVCEPIVGRRVRVLALLAVPGDKCIDQARIDWLKIFPGQLELCEQRRLEVRYEDIRTGDQFEKRRAPGALGQVDEEAAFVAAGQKPGVVKIGARISRNRGEGTPQITVGRAPDFDHVGAEIRQDGGRRRSGYIGGAVDNFESGKYTLVRIHKTPAPKR